ncbi:MAG: DsrE/DsrF/DrsH-like family protein [Candidatus Neomarinimicrobiota bacterium]
MMKTKKRSSEPKRLALVASRGTLDWAYSPFILASTAAAMEMEVAMFFTFYGLTLLKKKIEAKVAPHANPAMPMRIPFGPQGLQNIQWPVPNLLSTNLPGFETVATSLMKQAFRKNGVATVEELRDICLESGVRLIGCTMTMDVFGINKDDFIEGVELGGAATFLEYAADADIQLFI